jgi:hypothetical protein
VAAAIQYCVRIGEPAKNAYDTTHPAMQNTRRLAALFGELKAYAADTGRMIAQSGSDLECWKRRRAHLHGERESYRTPGGFNPIRLKGELRDNVQNAFSR